jgi:hypothetical protein
VLRFGVGDSVPPVTMKTNDEQTTTSGTETPPRGIALSDSRPLLESLDTAQLQDVSVSRGVQALWQAVLPILGMLPSRPGEYPGMFRVEPGPGSEEATIYIDIPAEDYERGKKPRMERVVALTVRLSHDYRLFGDQYYCVDCEQPQDEARH